MSDPQDWSLLLDHIRSYVDKGNLDEDLKRARSIAQPFKHLRGDLRKGRQEHFHERLKGAVKRSEGSFLLGLKGANKAKHLRNVYVWNPDKARDALQRLWNEEDPLRDRIAAFADEYPYHKKSEIWTRVRVISMLLMACGQDHPPIRGAVMKTAYRGTRWPMSPKGPRTEAALYEHARKFLRKVVEKARGAGLKRPGNLLEARLAIDDWAPPGEAEMQASGHERIGSAIGQGVAMSTQPAPGDSTAAQPEADRSANATVSTEMPGQLEHAGSQQNSPRSMSAEDLEKARCAAQETGRLGEALVDRYLDQLKVSGEIADYKWQSKASATSPFDFRVLRDNRWEKLEVKSTRKHFEREYYLSRAELREAGTDDSSYRVARVYALTPEAARMRISRPLRDFAQSICTVLDKLPDGVAADTLCIVPTDDLFDEEVIDLAGPADGQ